MPFTFFAHQTLVVPLKAQRPRWFDGTALCVGSMAPDLSYIVNKTRLDFGTFAHSVAGQFVWTLPIAVVLTLVWRHVVAAPFGAVLPGRLGEQVAALARARRPLVQTAWCAVLGGLSHVFLDGMTHAGGWAVLRIRLLRHPIVLAGYKYPLFRWLQYLGHSVGTLVGVVMFVVLIHRRRFSRWSASPGDLAARPAARHPLAMGLSIGIASAVGIAVAAAAPRDLSAALIRAAWAGLAGLLAGALIARASDARPGLEP